jgi:hypothetical protein
MLSGGKLLQQRSLRVVLTATQGLRAGLSDENVHKKEVQKINKLAEEMTRASLDKRHCGVKLEVADDQKQREGGKLSVELLIKGVIACRMRRQTKRS